MKRRIIFASCLVGLFILGFVAVRALGFVPGRVDKRVEALQTLVGQNVRLGDPPDRVISFLVSEHLEHSMLETPEIMRINGHDYDNQNVIGAIKRHTAGSLIWREDIEIVFVLNEKHQLAKFDVIPVYTSF